MKAVNHNKYKKCKRFHSITYCNIQAGLYKGIAIHNLMGESSSDIA